MTHSFEQEEAELTAFIREALDLPEADDVTVYSWADRYGGYRISEISLYRPDPVRGLPFGGGSSWMQSDPEAGTVLLAAERFVVSREDEIEEFEGDTYVDYRQEREQALRFALTGSFGEGWEDRRSA